MNLVRRVLLGAIVSMWSVAASAAVMFDVDAASSGVDSSGISVGCGLFSSCDFDIDLVSDLDLVSFNLVVGQSETFDFLEANWSGAGGASGTVVADLGFSAPGGVGTGTGSGIVGFAGSIGAFGVLSWSPIADIVLGDGTSYGIALQDLDLGIALGSSVGVSATVTLLAAPVPEPSTLALLGFGAMGLVSLRRKRR